MLLELPGRRGQYQRTQFWDDRELRATAPDGSVYVVVERWIGEDDEAQVTIRVRTADGTKRYERRITVAPVPLTERMVDSTVQSLAKLLAGVYPSVTAARDAILKNTIRPRRLPAARRALAGRDRTIWIEVETGRPSHLWHVFDDQGRAMGMLETEPNIHLMEASSTLVLGFALDENDVPTPVRMKVLR